MRRRLGYSQDQNTASQGIKFHREIAQRRLEDMVAPASLNDLGMTPDGPVIGGQSGERFEGNFEIAK